MSRTEKLDDGKGFTYFDRDDDHVTVIRRKHNLMEPFIFRTSQDGAYLTIEQVEHLIAFLTRPCTCTMPADCPAHGTEVSG